jgi:MFS superfamily sulfate permease-like transporter
LSEKLPSTGLRGIRDHWRDDLSAAVSVSLVALPLALGIALASGVPPMSGILAAIIGGVVTTIFRGSYVAINGPAAGLIVVILTGVETLADEGSTGFPYVLAAIVVAGIIQAILGLLRMGKLGDMFPSSVVNGMLATIGIIIFVKQFPVAFGVKHSGGSILDGIASMPSDVMNLNPLITLIAALSLLILIVHPRLTNSFIKSIPAPLLVLVVAIPIVFVFNFFGDPEVKVFGIPAYIGNEYLIHIPSNLMDSIVFPNFSKIAHPQFWLVVISLTMVASIETLISTKAVDKLDHYKRRTNLNKDFFAVGLSTAVSGFLGGLPIITVIVRSSVNVNHNAKTKWSNMYHGLLLLAFVFLFPFIINEIPEACLAAILLYTGYKLASPRVFKATLLKGWEQVLILTTTVIASLTLNLLWGILIGIVATILIQWARTGLNFKTFMSHLWHTEIKLVEESNNTVLVEINGIANFAIVLKLISSLEQLQNNRSFIVNFSRTKLVDSTVMEFIHEHREKYFTQSDFEFIGLDVHKTSSPHPLALHILEKPMQKRLTGRQNDISHYASENGYKFHPEIDWDVEHLERFAFFEFHLLEYERNRLTGTFEGDFKWLISDLTYNDGIMMAREEHHLTVMVIYLPFETEATIVTKDNVRNIKTLVRKGQSEEVLKDHSEAFIALLEKNASYYIECAQDEILLFRKERFLSTNEIKKLHDFAEKLTPLVPRKG